MAVQGSAFLVRGIAMSPCTIPWSEDKKGNRIVNGVKSVNPPLEKRISTIPMFSLAFAMMLVTSKDSSGIRENTFTKRDAGAKKRVWVYFKSFWTHHQVHPGLHSETKGLINVWSWFLFWNPGRIHLSRKKQSDLLVEWLSTLGWGGETESRWWSSLAGPWMWKNSQNLSIKRSSKRSEEDVTCGTLTLVCNAGGVSSYYICCS